MYYPKSQIKPNLYCNGELVLSSDNTLYVGYYWENSQGKKYTGKTPQDSPTIELIEIKNNNAQTDDINISPSLDALVYDFIKNPKKNNPTLPQYNQNTPTENDYKIGEYVRYFCKKTNENIYIEINKDTYNKLLDKDQTIQWQLYFPFSLSWQITGDKQQVAQTNKNIVELTSFRLKLPYFNLYLKNDYIKWIK